jgi:hypothetical protein
MQLNHLIDPKQKQANLDEAVSAHMQAKDTANQGAIILIFTAVTIIFVSILY